MTRSFSRIELADTSRKDSAQSPAWSRNALPSATSAKPGRQVAGLTGEDERRPLGERLFDGLELGLVGPLGLLHGRERAPRGRVARRRRAAATW